MALGNISNVYQRQGKFSEALSTLKQVLAIFEKVHGRNHLKPAKTKLNIGSIYSSMGEYVRAPNTYNEALPVVETELGCDHQLTADTRNKCALPS